MVALGLAERTLLLQAWSRIPGDDSSSQSTAHAETCSVIAEREKRLRRRAKSYTFVNPFQLTVLKVQSTVLPLQRGIDWRIHLVLPLRLAGVDIEGHSPLLPAR